MRAGRLLCLLIATLGALTALAACGDDDDGAAKSGIVIEDADAIIVSENLQFDPTEIEVPANEEATIAHSNRDEGTPHNIHLVDAPGEPKTELATGPGSQLLDVTLDPGEYQIVCDLHPDMQATVTAV